FLAREIAALRISIERKADREDLADAAREITLAVDRLHDQVASDPGRESEVRAGLHQPGSRGGLHEPHAGGSGEARGETED
ncbi:MAG: hypothetical protein LC720_02950, partial [Actinobacteria bacterium]|nr:hypothetical protein [Actinomycetota bacterium]